MTILRPAQRVKPLGARRFVSVRPHGYERQGSTVATERLSTHVKPGPDMIVERGRDGNDLSMAAWIDTRYVGLTSFRGNGASCGEGFPEVESPHAGGRSRPMLTNLAVEITAPGVCQPNVRGVMNRNYHPTGADAGRVNLS